MKSFINYTNDRLTAIMLKYGVFFAYNQKQFNENKKDGVKYTRLDAGILCPSDNVDAFIKDTDDLDTVARQERVDEYGIDAIIYDELDNYECWYTDDPSDAIKELVQYEGITKEMVLSKFYGKGELT